MADPELPPGFVLDAAAAEPALPPGFVLDSDEPAETRPFRNTGPDLEGQLKRESAAAAAAPSATEAFLRHAGNAASFGAGPAIEAAVTPGDYDANRRAILARNEAAEAAHPIASGAGSLVGTGATMLLPVGQVAEGAGAAAQALAGAKAGAAYSALGAAGSGLSAGKSAGEIVTDVIHQGALGAATGGVLGGALGKVIGEAPERVDDRIIANISRGEGGGATKRSLADKVAAADEAGDVIPQLEKTGLKKTVATQAAASPGKVADKFQDVIDKYSTQRLAPIYSAIDAAGTAPKGFDLKYSLLQLQDKLKTSGELQQSASVGNYLNFLDKHVNDSQQLTGSWIRKARNEVGLGNTFATHEEAATPAGVKAKMAIYAAFNDAIEGAAARTPGVDVAYLKSANKTVSTLLTVRDALKNRALKDASGGTGIGTAISGGVTRVAQAGMAMRALGQLGSGDVAGLGQTAMELIGSEIGKHVITKTVPQIVRRGDYGLASLENAARAGSGTAQVARGALASGAAMVAAPRVARGIDRLIGPRLPDDETQP